MDKSEKLDLIEAYSGTLMALTNSIGEWSAQNFGKQNPVNPLLGVVEELGEYARAEFLDEKMDALADCMIYICDYVHRLDSCIVDADLIDNIIVINAGKTPDYYKQYYDYELIDLAGDICHSALKHRQKIRNNENHLENIRINLKRLVVKLALETYLLKNQNIIDLTEQVFNETVSKRDWTKNTNNGRDE